MKPSKILLIACSFAFSSAVLAAEKPTAKDEVVLTKDKPGHENAWMENMTALPVLKLQAMHITNPQGLGVASFDLELTKPATVIIEPVKRSYQYVFIPRFDWRCQKK